MAVGLRHKTTVGQKVGAENTRREKDPVSPPPYPQRQTMTWPIYGFLAAILAALAYQIYATTNIERTLMSLQDTIDNITAELVTVRERITAEIAALHQQIAAGVPSEQLDLSALQAAADALEAITLEEGVDNATDTVKGDKPEAADLKNPKA